MREQVLWVDAPYLNLPIATIKWPDAVYAHYGARRRVASVTLCVTIERHVLGRPPLGQPGCNTRLDTLAAMDTSRIATPSGRSGRGARHCTSRIARVSSFRAAVQMRRVGMPSRHRWGDADSQVPWSCPSAHAQRLNDEERLR